MRVKPFFFLQNFKDFFIIFLLLLFCIFCFAKNLFLSEANPSGSSFVCMTAKRSFYNIDSRLTTTKCFALFGNDRTYGNLQCKMYNVIINDNSKLLLFKEHFWYNRREIKALQSIYLFVGLLLCFDKISEICRFKELAEIFLTEYFEYIPLSSALLIFQSSGLSKQHARLRHLYYYRHQIY